MWAESIPQIQSAFSLMFSGAMIIVGVTAFYWWLRFLNFICNCVFGLFGAKPTTLLETLGFRLCPERKRPVRRRG